MDDSRNVRIAVSRGSVRLPMNGFDGLLLPIVRVVIALHLVVLNTPGGTRREENQRLTKSLSCIFTYIDTVARSMIVGMMLCFVGVNTPDFFLDFNLPSIAWWWQQYPLSLTDLILKFLSKDDEEKEVNDRVSIIEVKVSKSDAHSRHFRAC